MDTNTKPAAAPVWGTKAWVDANPERFAQWRRKWGAAMLGLVALLAALIVGVLLIDHRDRHRELPSDSATWRVTAPNLAEMMAANELAPEAARAGRAMHVVGRVERLEVPLFGGPLITFEGASPALQAGLKDQAAAQLGAVQAGQEVELACARAGLWSDKPRVNDCTLVRIGEQAVAPTMDAQVGRAVLP